MSKVKIVLMCVGFIILILALDYGSVLWQSIIAPKREQVRRDVFETTRSFNEGMAQELARYKMQYDLAETEREQTIIANTIRHRFAEYDSESMRDSGLRLFLRQMRGY